MREIKRDKKNAKMVACICDLYDRAMAGVVGSKSVQDLADDYLRKTDFDINSAARDFISMQLAKCAVSGVVSCCGGFATRCVLLPVNVVNVLYVQIRMAMVLAHMGGYDLKSERVKTAVFLSLAGENVDMVLQGVRSLEDTDLAMNAARVIPRQFFDIVDKIIDRGIVKQVCSNKVFSFGKLIPVFGAIVGGVIDYNTTDTIATTAYRLFIEGRLEKDDRELLHHQLSEDSVGVDVPSKHAKEQ